MTTLENIPTDVASLLYRLKITPNYKGYEPLKSGIKAVVADEDQLRDVTKKLYPTLAELRGTNWKNLEFNMRRCITICWERGGKETYCEIAGEDLETAVKPKPREFICALANYIIRRGEEAD